MGQSVKRTRFYEITQGIFPLKTSLSDEELFVGKRDRYPYIRGLEISYRTPLFIRAKLAVFELLYAKFGLEQHLKELHYFSSNYSSSKMPLSLEDESYSDNFKDRLMLFNYFKLHNKVRDTGLSSFREEYEIKSKIESDHFSTRECVLEVLFLKGFIPDIGLRAFEKRLNKICETYGIDRFVGRPTDDFEFGLDDEEFKLHHDRILKEYA